MPSALSNRFLSALADKERHSLSSLLEPVALPAGTLLFQEHERPRHVHFLTSGLASVITKTSTGLTAEVRWTGRDGFPEARQLLGAERGNRQAVVQIAGHALRIDFARFRQLFWQNEVLRDQVLHFLQCESLAQSHFSDCNRLHRIDQRLACWLSRIHAHTGETTLALSPHLLSQMLGVHHEAVTSAAEELERAGILEYSRTVIRILDLERLCEAACGCDAAVHGLFRKLYR